MLTVNTVISNTLWYTLLAWLIGCVRKQLEKKTQLIKVIGLSGVQFGL